MAHAWGGADEFHWSIAKNDHELSPGFLWGCWSAQMSPLIVPLRCIQTKLHIHWDLNTNPTDSESLLPNTHKTKPLLLYTPPPPPPRTRTLCCGGKLKVGAVSGVTRSSASAHVEDIHSGGSEACDHHAGGSGACRGVAQLLLLLDKQQHIMRDSKQKHILAIKCLNKTYFLLLNMTEVSLSAFVCELAALQKYFFFQFL